MRHIKLNGTGIQLCTCGRRSSEDKSFFAKEDIVMGAIVLFVATSVLLFKTRELAIVLLMFVIMAVPIFIVFIIGSVQGHSLRCSSRWALAVALGVIGGFWFVGF